MKVNVLEISSPRKQSALANVRIELVDADGNVITIDDMRVLRNRQSQLWVAFPTYSVPDGKSFRYQQTVILSRELKRQVEDTCLQAYDRWAAPAQGSAR
jgi:DNA-binding cell septation regulator SpoVG